MRHRRLRASVLGLVSLVVLPLVARAQENAPARGLFISGFVRDDNTQQPISAVNLELQRISGDFASPPVTSGTRGEYQFNGIISGDYRVLAQVKGYEPASVSVMLGGVPMFNVNVMMRRVPTERVTPSGDSVSLHQLNVPDKARDDFEKGMKLLLSPKPDYRKALSCFERATKEYGDYYEAFAEMGVAYQHLGDAAAAEKALRRSVEMSSSRYPDALFLLAEMLNDAGRFIDSEVFARQCVTQDESSWSCELELARALSGLKHPAEAEAIATRASELNPNNAKTFLVLGNIHIQQKKYDAVVKDFDTYLKLDPSGPMSDQVRASEAQARRAMSKLPATNSVPQ